MSEQIAPIDHQQVGADFLRQQQRPRADADYAAAVGDHVFRAMHGFYGNLWLNKFSTGSMTAAGGDEGFESARRMWGFALARYPREVIRLALGKCLGEQSAFVKFPPGLPEFVALCESCRPRPAYKPPENAIGMSQELRSSYTRRLREVNQRHLQSARDKAAGGSGRLVEPEVQGIPLLNALVAESVGLAGGDEAATLLAMDRRIVRAT